MTAIRITSLVDNSFSLGIFGAVSKSFMRHSEGWVGRMGINNRIIECCRCVGSPNIATGNRLVCLSKIGGFSELSVFVIGRLRRFFLSFYNH